MKKKLLVVLSALLAFNTIPLSAAAGGITPPTDSDYQTYDAADPQNKANEIPGWGYIGIDGQITPDPDPTNPPIVDPDDSNISVEVPVQFLWAAFESDQGEITAPTYRITNKSKSVDLNVTLASFAQTNAAEVTIPGTLKLNMTGNMAVTDVIGKTEVNFPGKLTAENKWDFSFDGTYAGDFTSAALGGSYIRPQYEMKLTFAVSH